MSEQQETPNKPLWGKKMSIKLEDLTCERCIYFQLKGQDCRRKSPLFDDEQNGVWPYVLPKAWCGDGEWLVWWYSSEDSELLDIMFIDRKQYMTHTGYYMWPEE